MGVEKKLKCNVDRLMKPLTKALINGLQAVFGEVRRSVDYRLATSLIRPKFTLAFLSDDEKMHHKQLLVSCVNDVCREVNAAQMLPAAASGSSSSLPHYSDDDDLYSFLNKPQTSTAAELGSVELLFWKASATRGNACKLLIDCDLAARYPSTHSVM